MRCLWCFLCLVLCAASPSFSQTCLGRVSFGHRPTSVSLGGAVSADAGAIGLGVAGGEARGFGGIDLTLVDFDAVGANAIGVSGGGAREARVGRIAVCPGGSAGITFGPTATVNFGEREATHEEGRVVRLAASVNIGAAVVDTPSIQVIPTGGMEIVYLNGTAALQDESASTTAEFGLLHVGVGLVFKRSISITPTVSVPFAIDRRRSVFSIVAAFGFGG